MGQSYQDGTVRHGKLDEYAADSPALPGSSQRVLPPMTTSAQAEGAIEGVYTEYKLASPLSTAFAYSRYDYERTAARPTGGLPQATRTASATEWDGAAAMAEAAAPLRPHQRQALGLRLLQCRPLAL